MNFHETQYGRCFFGGQFPKLINALEAIATAMEHKTLSVQNLADTSPDYLKNLNHGRLESDRELNTCDLLDRNVETAYAQLVEHVPSELIHYIEDYRAVADECSNLYRDNAFATGYQTAMRLVVAFTEKKEKE